MARLRPRETPNFTKSEIDQMEKLLKEIGEESLSESFCDKVAKKFSRDTGRSGKPAIQWTQVQNWFQNNYQACISRVVPSPIVPKDWVATPNAPIPNGFPENSSAIPKVEELPDICKPDTVEELPDICKPNTVEELPDISELEFEAQSSKDGAWYDVSVFLTHRVLSSGEPEVRVRFVGFGAEEDEWVNVKKAVRERSVPLEPSECQKVNIGDLVLCFQERSDQAIYFDAHVIEIERKVHDVRGCRCLFLVRYDHDNVEEKVRLRRLCRRP